MRRASEDGRFEILLSATFDGAHDSWAEYLCLQRCRDSGVTLTSRAREILAEGANGSLLKARFILAGERLYTVVAVAPAGDGAMEEMDRFLNSFMLLKP